MPAKKKVTPKVEEKKTPVITQEIQIIRGLVELVRIISPGHDYTILLRAERYLTEKEK